MSIRPTLVTLYLTTDNKVRVRVVAVTESNDRIIGVTAPVDAGKAQEATAELIKQLEKARAHISAPDEFTPLVSK